MSWLTKSPLPLAGLIVSILTAVNCGLSGYWKRHPKAAEWIWAGDVTPTSFELRVKTGGKRLLKVKPKGSTDESQAISVDIAEAGLHKVSIPGLQPSTEYQYHLVDSVAADGAPAIGRVKTWATGVQPALRVGVAACATKGSNDPVFDEIADHEYDLFIQMGDLHYHDIDVNDTKLYLDAYSQVHGAPRQQRLFRSAPVAYVWDDHDFGANDCNSLSPSAGAARQALQLAVPKPEVHGHPLAAYHAFSVGRTRFVMIDARSEEVPELALMSAAQMQWLLAEIANPGSHKLLVLMLGQPWIGEEKPGDGWLGHLPERKKVSEAIAASKAAGGYQNVIGVSGDAHMLAFDDGTNTDFSDTGGAGFPLLHAGPLDRSGSAKGGPYTSQCMAYKLADTHQFGSLEITDTGGSGAESICVHFRMHRGGSGVIHEERMCGPLLTPRKSPSTDCSIPLMPPFQLAMMVLTILSFVAMLTLAVCWQVRDHSCRGWLYVLAALVCFLPQVVLYLLQKSGQWPLDPPWRPFLFQVLAQAVLLAAMVASSTCWRPKPSSREEISDDASDDEDTTQTGTG